MKVNNATTKSMNATIHQMLHK